MPVFRAVLLAIEETGVEEFTAEKGGIGKGMPLIEEVVDLAFGIDFARFEAGGEIL